MIVGQQFALWGFPKDIQAGKPPYEPEIVPAHLLRDRSTQMWSGHDNPQLPMFLTAREIMHNYRALNYDRGAGSNPRGWETDRELYSRKAEEAENPTDVGLGSGAGVKGLRDQNYRWDTVLPLSLPRESPDEPVVEGTTDFMKSPPVDSATEGPDDTRPEILDGHHRLAEMAGEQPDGLIPVTHVPGKQYNGAMGRSRRTL